MPKGIDLSKFKKIDANKDHTIMQSADGHVIHISHKAISKEMHDALRNLPIQKLAYGGVVQKMSQGGPVSKEAADNFAKSFQNASGKPAVAKAAAKFGIKKMSDGGIVGIQGEDVERRELSPFLKHIADSVIGGASSTAEAFGNLGNAALDVVAPRVPKATGVPVDSELPEQTVFSDEVANKLSPSSPENIEIPKTAPIEGMSAAAPEEPGVIEQANKDYQAGLQQEVKATSDIASGQQKALEAQQARIQEHTELLKENVKKQKESYDSFAQYISDPQNNVNPQRYMANKGTWGRMSTAIGLALGGAPAWEFLNKQIQEDIDAQKRDVENKKTLYAENLKLLGNEEAAFEKTLLMMNQFAENQIKIAALKQASPQAKAHALKLAGEFAMKNGELLVNEAKRKTQQQILGSTPTGPIPVSRAEQLVRSGVVPPQFQAEAMKELEFVKGLDEKIKNLNKVYSEALQLNTAASAVPLTEQNAKLSLINAKIQQAFREARPPGSGPLTDKDEKAVITPYLVELKDLVNPSRIAQKVQAAKKALGEGYSKAGTLSTYGIKVAPPIETKLGPKPQGGK